MMAILSALLGAVLGFFATGLGAASLLSSTLGDRDGGSSMGGFFSFGPIGAAAGALLGAGLALRFGGGSAGWAKGLLIGAGVVVAMGGVLLATTAFPDRGPSYTYVIEFQLEYPAAAFEGVDIPGPNAMWGAGSGDSEAKPISQFHEKKCEGGVCVVSGSVAALGSMGGFRITTALGSRKSSYPLNLPTNISAAADWSPWRPEDNARARWRIVQR